MNSISFRRLIWIVVLVSIFASCACAAPKIDDFTFIQVSDIHAPNKESAATIAQIPTLGDIVLKPYNVTAKPPSFVIATGDMTEFGGYQGAWEEYLSYWKLSRWRLLCP